MDFFFISCVAVPTICLRCWQPTWRALIMHAFTIGEVRDLIVYPPGNPQESGSGFGSIG